MKRTLQIARALRIAVLMLCVGVANASLAATPAREALVIGNGAYRDVPLRNPANDAKAIAASLEKLGFRTRLVLDADWRQLLETVRKFASDAAQAEVRLVFYAGHGAQVRGRNYMIPVDAPMVDVDEMIGRSVDVGEMLDRLSRSGTGLSLLILDACRTNPAAQYQLLADGRRVKMRGAAPGLAPMAAPAGSLVAFATAPGSVADDRGGGTHSLYTLHLLRDLATPGVPLEELFKRVRIGVMRDSQQRQRPWEESSLTVDYCLAAPATGRACGERPYPDPNRKDPR